MSEFLKFVAGVLGVSLEKVTPTLGYGDIPEWDSIMHLRLVMEMQDKYGIHIDISDIPQLTTIEKLFFSISTPLHGQPKEIKKVLCLDYDGVLWQGVIGEDGIAGIVPNVELQRKAKELKAKGMLLVGLSKNNAEDVAAVWSDERMILKAEDFVLQYVNWEPKAENIAAAAKKLNLGLESFVFVDDRAIERERMTAAHPEVEVRENLDGFEPEGLIARDTTALYLQNFRRLETTRPDLKIESEIHDVREDELKRVSELSRKSNQFNLTTRRHFVEDLKAMLARGVKIKVLYSRDIYGDLGLVAFAAAENGRITDLVLSCRAMDRGHEDELYRAMGSLPVDLVKTAKNGPAQKWHTALS